MNSPSTGLTPGHHRGPGLSAGSSYAPQGRGSAQPRDTLGGLGQASLIGARRKPCGDPVEVSIGRQQQQVVARAHRRHRDIGDVSPAGDRRHVEVVTDQDAGEPAFRAQQIENRRRAHRRLVGVDGGKRPRTDHDAARPGLDRGLERGKVRDELAAVDRHDGVRRQRGVGLQPPMPREVLGRGCHAGPLHSAYEYGADPRRVGRVADETHGQPRAVGGQVEHRCQDERRHPSDQRAERRCAAHIHYTLDSVRAGTAMFHVVVPGERWEIEILAGGHVEVEIFRSDGEIDGADASRRCLRDSQTTPDGASGTPPTSPRWRSDACSVSKSYRLVARTLEFTLEAALAIRAWLDSLVQLQVGAGARGGCPIGSLVGQLAETDQQARQLLTDGFARWEEPLRASRPSKDATARQAQPQRQPRSARDRNTRRIQGGLVPSRTRRDPNQTSSPSP